MASNSNNLDEVNNWMAGITMTLCCAAFVTLFYDVFWNGPKRAPLNKTQLAAQGRFLIEEDEMKTIEREIRIMAEQPDQESKDKQFHKVLSYIEQLQTAAKTSGEKPLVQLP